MPTYEYKCEKCGDFEIWQSIKDNALLLCPTCGSKVQRQISANVGFVFKGAGFYQNEYKDGGSANAKTKTTAAPSPEVKKETTPADSSAPSGGTTPSAGSKNLPQANSGQGCGACGSPDPCSPGNN